MEVTALGFCLAFQTLPLLVHRFPAGRPFSLSNHLSSLLPPSCHTWFRWQTLGGSLSGSGVLGAILSPQRSSTPALHAFLPYWQTAEGSQDHCVDNSVCGFAVETMRGSKARGQLKKHTWKTIKRDTAEGKGGFSQATVCMLRTEPPPWLWT